MPTILRQRRDTAANWTTNNPVIPDGQLCFDETNNTFRIGDGATNYGSLPIQSGAAGADGADGTISGNLGTDLNMNGFSIVNPDITGSITEETSIATDVFEPDNGTMQYRTLVANTTFTDGLAEGQTLTLYLTNAGFTVTYPTISWDGGTEPTLGTTDRLYFEKVNGTLYGFITGAF